MVDRIQLTQDVYMNLEGQWRVVKCGSVLDIANARSISPEHRALLSPTEAAGSLGAHGKATPVRNVTSR